MLYTYTLLVSMFLVYPGSSTPTSFGYSTPIESLELCNEAKAEVLAGQMPDIVNQSSAKPVYSSREVHCIKRRAIAE